MSTCLWVPSRINFADSVISSTQTNGEAKLILIRFPLKSFFFVQKHGKIINTQKRQIKNC